MYFSKINVDRRNPSARQALCDCRDMHRNIMKLFGTDRTGAGVLYRVCKNGEGICIYLMSKSCPNCPGERSGFSLVGTKSVDTLEKRFEAGQRYMFELLTFPSKKVGGEGIKHSQRRALRSTDERNAWLCRKAAESGFEVLWSREDGIDKLYAHHGSEDGGAMYVDAVCFRGALRICDRDKFAFAYENGIGSNKSYGLGMLLLSAGG